MSQLSGRTRATIALSVGALLVPVVPLAALVRPAAGAATAASTAAAATLYVSPTGDDANPGTQDRPVRSLQRVRDLVRALNQDMAGDIVVELAYGTYRLSSPLALTTRDSGTNGHDVIYRAAAGARPVVSGGVRVTGWRVSDAGRNIWFAAAPSGLSSTRQLYVDGARAMRARGRVPVSLTATATGYRASADTMSRWRNQGDVEFVYTGGNGLWSNGTSGLGGWTEPRCPVGSISGTAITMAQPCWDNSPKRVKNLVGPSKVGGPTQVENAYELLDQPGEWYLDRPARTVYYIPRGGEDLATADVEAPVLETLLSPPRVCATGCRTAPARTAPGARPTATSGSPTTAASSSGTARSCTWAARR